MESKTIPHVLIFPFPAQGHVNSMLKLAELLCLSDLHVTFLNTDNVQLHLHRSADIKTRFACFPRFRFETISDGLPVDQFRPSTSIWQLLYSASTVFSTQFRDRLVSGQVKSEGRLPVSCVIADGILGFAVDVAQQLGIPCISFRTPGASYYWVNVCLPKLIQAEEIPFKGNKFDLFALMEEKIVPPHVLILPFPAQGHINSMLKLAELLGLSKLHVTFVNTEHNQLRLNSFTDVEARFGNFPNFRFKTVPDGLPDGHPRSFYIIADMIDMVRNNIQPVFHEVVISAGLRSGRPPVSCIIADGILGFTIDVAQEVGIPSISFRTPSTCYYWISICLPKLIELGEVPFKDDNLDQAIKSVPGMEGFLRRRDLPSFCRSKELNDPGLQLILNETIKAKSAAAHILNTFEDLEGAVLSRFHPHFSKIYAIGPLHALLDSRRRKNSSQTSTSSNSLLQVDRSCMAWLDSQPPKSVVYVSFGSVVHMKQSQMTEFWFGLVNSGKRFLWVIRPDSVTEKDGTSNVPAELQEATKERGCVVDWCPQEEVLVHPAVGAFVTHSGWNSTMEAIVAGVPMICWPGFADQPVNSRFVSEVWKIGFDMKDTCDRSTIEKKIRDVMDDKRNELMVSVDRMAEKARKSVDEGGSSYRNLELLIQDIKNDEVGIKP